VDLLAGEGARPASSAAEVGSASDIVLTSLTNTPAVEAVYFGKNGLLEAARPGQILADHSTVAPDTSRKCAEAAQAKGAAFLDAPVSGGMAGAENATLTIMVGGDAAAFEKAKQAFQAYGKNIHHVGGTGIGSVVKLINQLWVATNTAAVVEGVILGAKAGADPRVLVEVIGSSYGGSTMLTRNVPFFLSRNFAPGTPVSLVLKDMASVRELAKQHTVRLLMGSLAEEIFEEARDQGWNDDDMAGIVRSLERLAKFEVRAEP
jgi:3-hydroxyisobutyrate dehydrogenase-like beta-hydroxyacid dehydrogenase